MQDIIMTALRKKKDSEDLNRIGVILNERERSVYWLAKKLEYSYPTVAGWVKNDSQPNLDQLSDIAKVLGTSIGDLLTEDVR